MRLQIILQLRPNPNIGSFFAKLPELFLPVLWFDAEAAIDEEMASQVLFEKNTKKEPTGPRKKWHTKKNNPAKTNYYSLSQVKLLAAMPMAGLIFGGLSLAGAALCLLLFFCVRCETNIFKFHL